MVGLVCFIANQMLSIPGTVCERHPLPDLDRAVAMLDSVLPQQLDQRPATKDRWDSDCDSFRCLDDSISLRCCASRRSIGGVGDLATSSKFFSSALRDSMLTMAKFVRWVGVEASGLAIEIACWIFAVSLVATLNMPIFTRLKLIFIFALRLLYVSSSISSALSLTAYSLIPFIVLRLLSLSPSSFSGSTHNIVTVEIFTQAAMHFALVSECLTCLRPFMQTFHEGLAPGTGMNYWGGLSQVSQPRSKASGGESDLKRHIRVVANRVPGDEDHQQSGRWQRGDEGNFQLRGDHTGFSAQIESRRNDDEWASAGSDDIELLPSSRNIHVRKSMTMSVSQ